VQIDRSDLADEPSHAHVALRTRSAPDDPDVAGKDVGKAVGSDGLPDSSATHDQALRIERTATYRAAVDTAYRQYAIDHGGALVKTSGTETVIPGTRGPRYLTAGTAADDVHTGARGPASGREFAPEAAGGPIRQLDAGKERITNEGVKEATAHLKRFTQGGPLEAPEQGMLDRLTSIAAGDIEPTSYDLNFYTHELDEGVGMPNSASGLNQAWISGALRCSKYGTMSTPPRSRISGSLTQISSILRWRHE
jgi:hypothetical protein